jgi:hypothetical protein
MNAIVLMASGKKYLKDLAAVKPSFERYAKRCQAQLVICETPPDPTFKRNILCQKLLIPHLYKQYEWIAFCDIDILISKDAPSIFDHIDETRAFSSVVDKRSSLKYINVVRELWEKPGILTETHESYFSSRGFPDHPFPKGSINGGVWLCKPARIAEEFRRFYFSDLVPDSPHEEAPMAYLSQKNGLFYELDSRFNAQLIYDLFTPPRSLVTKKIRGLYFRGLKRLHKQTHPASFMYPKAYKDLVSEALGRSYFLHFSGGFPFINMRSDMEIGALPDR